MGGTAAGAAKARAIRERKRPVIIGGEDLGLQQEIKHLRDQIGQTINTMYGASGLHVTQGTIDEEYVPELKIHSGRAAIFEQMANDPIVRGQLRAISATLLSGVRWRIEDGDKDLREIISANILRQG